MNFGSGFRACFNGILILILTSNFLVYSEAEIGVGKAVESEAEASGGVVPEQEGKVRYIKLNINGGVIDGIVVFI